MWTKKVFYVPYHLAWSPNGAQLAVATAKHVQFYSAATGAAAGVYRGHQGVVRAVAWSPDGTVVASAGEDQTVQIWHAVRRGLLYTYTAHQHPVYFVAWSPDGGSLASYSSSDRGSEVHVWQPGDSTPRTTLTDAGYTATRVAWSADGTLIARGSADDAIRLYHAVTGDVQLVYRGHQLPPVQMPMWTAVNPMQAFAWSPDGRVIASKNHNGSIHLWHAATGELIRQIPGVGALHYQLAWSPDSRWLAGHADEYTLHVWNARTGRLSASFQGHQQGQRQRIFTFAWSPDGRQMASLSMAHQLHMWSPTP